ncbi:tetratricopeptide repeat protein [Nannocystis sp. SCPEA4]|uniref:tetratricopeptide repeat protein n=1 Tax=Nannocystis sp. SCPEA4 TaxID=2996787 RepID=UPI00226DECA1|nr:tetratricopeptide repeat protein [Nannocystis sp. SCPEA4]MCY1054538.1 tetratricopeptide repeat protein [Nannocystis sp. SCPEA4]
MTGRTIADRFDVVAERHSLKSLFWQRNRDGHEIREDDLWILAVDRRTGERVRVLERARENFWQWAGDMWTEAVAHHVVAAASPHTVPILHVGPGVVFREPPPPGRPQLSPAEAAACALAACEVLSGLHAIGCGGEYPRRRDGSVAFDMPMPIDFGPHNLRLTRESGEWRIAWLVPSHCDLAFIDEPKYDYDSPPIARDLARLAGFYLALVPPAPGQPAVVDALRRLADGEPICHSVAELARLLLALVPDRDAWAPRVAALPVIDVLPAPVLDWDRVIAAGEEKLPTLVPRQHDYVAQPLAVAYHRRASDRAALAPADASRDVDRALELDPIAPYHITRAVLLDRLGRRADARAAVDLVLAEPDASATPADDDYDAIHLVDRRAFVLDDRERARAHATRGAIALRDGDLDRAEHDLRRALALDPTAAHAHALAAVLYACGDIDAAASLEARAVELEPTNARYHWDLAVSLHRLGRREEALVHARRADELEPRDPTCRARQVRLFGGS